MQIIITQTSSKYPAISGTDGKIETKTPEKLLPQGKISMVSCFFPLINFQKKQHKTSRAKCYIVIIIVVKSNDAGNQTWQWNIIHLYIDDFPMPRLIAKGFGEFGDDPPSEKTKTYWGHIGISPYRTLTKTMHYVW